MILSLKEKGETRFFDPISFSPSEKETVSSRQRKRGRGETFRMVSPHPFYRPEPCSGLAAYGSQKIYDRVCRGRCRAQLFATKERYRCGLPLAGTHRPVPASRGWPSPGGRWPEGPDEGLEHSTNCTMHRFCSPTLIRLAPLGAFPEGECFGAILRRSSAERRCAERRDLLGGRDLRNGRLMTEIF